MKNYLLWIFAAVAFAIAGFSCSDDPGVDSVGRVDIVQADLVADGLGEVIQFNVTSNAYWHIEFVDTETAEIVRWVSSDVTNGMGDDIVTLTVSRNRSSSPRYAYVKVITDSESDNASILLTQGAGGGGTSGYAFPICEMFKITSDNAFLNGYIEGNVCTFDDGLIITRTGEDASLTFVCPCHTAPATNGYFQRGMSAAAWTATDSWVFEMIVQEELSGSLRMLFGSRRDNAGSWKCEWSANGTSWTNFTTGVTAGPSVADAMWKSADFTVPAGTIAAGGKLYIKLTPNDYTKLNPPTVPTSLFQHGICILPATAALTALPAMDAATIVLSDGFDNVASAKACPIDVPMGFMTSTHHAGAYSLPAAQADIVTVTNGYSRPGFLQLGRGDEAFPTARYTLGSYTISLEKRFTAMNISKTDLKLTFLCSAMIDAYGVATDPGVFVKTDATSGATVESGTLQGVENNKFKSFTVYIRNAKPETRIAIQAAEMQSNSDDVRFFIDDVLLEVEGTPERPSADDPVKSDISVIRGKKGAGSVTITDNLYIQGRVVAVDNVPAGYFAIADTGSGLFVKQASHGLAAGDLAEVVVKDATLATDADGLLVLTPKAAANVKKVEVAAEMPAATSVTVAQLKAGTYEGMYVQMPASQVITADLAKTMSGSITLELEDQATNYTMKTYAGASFASTAVPQKSGVVKGVAGATVLLPTATSDLAAMTSARYGTAVYGITPISCFFKLLKANTGDYEFNNVSYANKTVTFSDPAGCTITKVGNGAEGDCVLMLKDASNWFYDGRFVTKGWGGENWDENGLVFKMKATSEIVGNLRFGFALFAAATSKVPGMWKVVWSNDNINWNEGVKIWGGDASTAYDGSESSTLDLPTAAAYKTAYFNVPAAKAIPSGSYIYVKLMPSDNSCHAAGQTVDPAAELILQHGVYLSTHEKRAYHTSVLPSGANVLLAEGFDDAFAGHDNFIPSWQFMTTYKSTYTLPENWTGTNYFQMPGYLRCGASGTGASTLVTPALAAIGDVPANIKIKFKASVLMVAAKGYTPDAGTITVTASNAGAVTGGAVNFTNLPGTSATTITRETAATMEAAYHRWYDYEVTVASATKDTKITFTNYARVFIDEIVITKE